MWYFAWMLGVGLACAFAILNAMWLEVLSDYQEGRAAEPPPPPAVEEIH